MTLARDWDCQMDGLKTDTTHTFDICIHLLLLLLLSGYPNFEN